jgi:hypothetical protein
MKDLTIGETANAWVRLRIVQAVQKQVDERLAFHDTEAFNELDEVERFAYAMISEAIAKMNGGLIADLRKDLEIDGTDEEVLAEVIELFDSQHRSRRDPR